MRKATPILAGDEKSKEISAVYFGNLVGRTREVLEATITDERQLRALSTVMMERMYDWWDKADEVGQFYKANN